MTVKEIPETVPARPRPQWATFIPSRRPDFKPHNSVGHAKNALTGIYRETGGFNEDMGLYRLHGDMYVLILKIRKGSKRDEYPTLAKVPRSRRDLLAQLEEMERFAEAARRGAEAAEAGLAALRKELEEWEE